MPSAIRAQAGNNRSFCVLEAGTARLTNHGSPPTPMDDWYDLSPIGKSRIAKYIVAMTKPFTLLTFAACLLAFLFLAPTAPGQSPEAAEEKAIALAQRLKLTPQQEVQVMPILKAEAPKFEAIKNDPSLSGMQKMEALHAIHSENAPQLQKILSPEQYQQLQAIRQADIKKAVEAKRAER